LFTILLDTDPIGPSPAPNNTRNMISEVKPHAMAGPAANSDQATIAKAIVFFGP